MLGMRLHGSTVSLLEAVVQGAWWPGRGVATATSHGHDREAATPLPHLLGVEGWSGDGGVVV